ncbi:MAG: hypothetical protein OEX14_04940 [Paracoccaceae bacterium]|nr:hypothetical protein [Paracoccaceae bacterium]
MAWFVRLAFKGGALQKVKAKGEEEARDAVSELQNGDAARFVRIGGRLITPADVEAASLVGEGMAAL